MIQIMKNKGWLVVAAALTIGLSACSSDEIASGGQTQQAGAAQTISVTVGAGFDADASTRSDVVYDETAKTRTLILTKGDRLFVEGYIGEEQTDADNAELTYYDFKIAGLLTMVENSLSSDGKTAQFSGELTLLTSKKVVDGESTYYTYEKNTKILIDFEGKDPLSEAKESFAVLIHEDGVDGEDFTLTDSYADFTSPYVKSAADVKTLMTTKLYVSGSEYDADHKSFKLKTYDNIIFNCAIDGLAASTSYKMVYCYKTFWSDYDSTTDFQNSIKTDASGKAVFAFAAYNSGWVKTHAIKFIPLNASGAVDENGEVMIADIIEVEQNGLKEDMVYNISRTATSESGASDDTYIKYSIENGVLTKSTPSIGEAKELSGAITESLAAGTYVVRGTATCSGNLTLAGDVNLILCDGSSLTVNDGGVYGGEDETHAGNYSMTIFGQSNNSGEFIVNYTNEQETTGTFQFKELTVHGGTITINSQVGQGIETGDGITIYGGIITTTGSQNGVNSMGPMAVYGGELTATSSGAAISIYPADGHDGILTIDGGKVIATSIVNSGIYAMDESGETGNIIIKSGTVIATSKNETEGIWAQGTIEISGGTVEAYGGAGGGKGIEGTLIVSGNAIVTAVGGDGKVEGLRNGAAGFDGALTVNGGTLTATGGAKAEGGDSDGLAISEETTITLGSGIKYYEDDEMPDTTSGGTENTATCTKRYVVIK